MSKDANIICNKIHIEREKNAKGTFFKINKSRNSEKLRALPIPENKNSKARKFLPRKNETESNFLILIMNLC